MKRIALVFATLVAIVAPAHAGKVGKPLDLLALAATPAVVSANWTLLEQYPLRGSKDRGCESLEANDEYYLLRQVKLNNHNGAWVSIKLERHEFNDPMLRATLCSTPLVLNKQ